MSKGSIIERGKNTWRLKFEAERDPVTNARRTQYLTVKGSKTEAHRILRRKLAEVDDGEFVEKSGDTLSEYARHWLKNIAPAKCSAKTLERYGEIVEKNIIPRIGEAQLQRLDAVKIDAFYGELRSATGRRDGKGKLSDQTILHIHRLLSKILLSATMAQKIRQSPMVRVQTKPTVRHEEKIEVLAPAELAALYKVVRATPLYMPVLLAASTGMRRGEVLGLRWRDIDFDAAELRVAQVVEQTTKGLAIKEPKTARSRRTIKLPGRLLQELKAHKAEQAALRLKLGIGKDERDLVFPNFLGNIWNPNNFTRAFAQAVSTAKLKRVSFHGLRHTHITRLLLDGVPVHVVSARAGHANPTVTLNIYSHLLPGAQDAATAMVDAALRSALEE